MIGSPDGISPGWRGYDALSLTLFAVLTAVVVATFGDYGVTYDELSHIEYGDRIRTFYRRGMRYSHIIDSAYGGGFDLLGSVARNVLRSRNAYDTMHLVGGLFGILGVVGAWKLGRELGGRAAGFWSALLLALTPVYYGHTFNNPKDAPFAVAYVWALYYLIRAIRMLPAVPRSVWIRLGVAMGIALGVRVAGLLLVCYVLMATALFVAHRAWLTRSAEHVYQVSRRMSVGVLTAIASAWVVMMFLWPWVSYYPMSRPFQALEVMSRFVEHERVIRFGDATFVSTEPPWDYLLRYFSFKLPELVLVLAIAGAGAAVYLVIRRRHIVSHFQRNLAFVVLGVAILLPPAYALYKGSTLYDGLRHFLFLVPPVVVVAGVTLAWMVRVAAARRRELAAAIVAIASLLCARQVYVMYRLHPHQYLHYNQFAGGLPGAFERYDTDYYGGTYREALDNLRAYLWATEPETYLNTRYVVKGCMPMGSMAFLPPNFAHEKRLERRADFWAAYTRGDCHRREADRPAVAKVTRDGSLLSVVRDLREPAPPDAAPWRAAYYPNNDMRGAPIVYSLADPEFDPELASPPVRQFSVRLDTCLEVEAPAAVRFMLKSTAPVVLFIDGDQVWDNGGNRIVPETDSMVLSSGFHHVRIDYFGAKGLPRFALRAAFGEEGSTPLPLGALRHPTDNAAGPCAGIEAEQ